MVQAGDLPARIQRHFDVSQDGCWLWRKPATNGYGYVHWGKMRKATRVVYELLVGEIPADLELDHLCRTPACVNPAHLEPVTHAENMRRSRNPNREKTHCPQGHPYDEENTIVYTGQKGRSRMCKKCQREYIRRWKERKKLERLAASSAP
jgi:hypothetical protein